MWGFAWLVSWDNKRMREFKTLLKSDTLWDIRWIDKKMVI